MCAHLEEGPGIRAAGGLELDSLWASLNCILGVWRLLLPQKWD